PGCGGFTSGGIVGGSAGRGTGCGCVGTSGPGGVGIFGDGIGVPHWGGPEKSGPEEQISNRVPPQIVAEVARLQPKASEVWRLQLHDGPETATARAFTRAASRGGEFSLHQFRCTAWNSSLIFIPSARQIR